MAGVVCNIIRESLYTLLDSNPSVVLGLRCYAAWCYKRCWHSYTDDHDDKPDALLFFTFTDHSMTVGYETICHIIMCGNITRVSQCIVNKMQSGIFDCAGNVTGSKY